MREFGVFVMFLICFWRSFSLFLNDSISQSRYRHTPCQKALLRLPNSSGTTTRNPLHTVPVESANRPKLPSDKVVKRKQVLEHGHLHKHPRGFFRPIECFKISKRGEATVLNGIQEEGRQVGAIVDKNIAIAAIQGLANGFAPMDLFHKRSRGATINENCGVPKRRVTKSPREK